MDQLHPDSKVIDRLQGPSAVARLCGVRPQAVSQWKRDGIPRARRQYLELLAPEAFKAPEPNSGDETTAEAA